MINRSYKQVALMSTLIVMSAFLMVFMGSTTVHADITSTLGTYKRSVTNYGATTYRHMLYGPERGFRATTTEQDWSNPSYTVSNPSGTVTRNGQRDPITEKVVYPGRILRQQTFTDINNPGVGRRTGNPATSYTGVIGDDLYIVGTATPYRYFHTTNQNHRIRIMAKFTDMDTGKQLGIKDLGVATNRNLSQTKRYSLQYTTVFDLISTRKGQTNANTITEKNYFDTTYSMSNIGGRSQDNPATGVLGMVDRVCGLGIVGATQQWVPGYMSSQRDNSCNYIYDYVGYEFTTNIKDLFRPYLNSGYDKINVEFKLFYEQTSYDKSKNTNKVVAPIELPVVLSEKNANYRIDTTEGERTGLLEFYTVDQMSYGAIEDGLQQKEQVSSNSYITPTGPWVPYFPTNSVTGTLGSIGVLGRYDYNSGTKLSNGFIDRPNLRYGYLRDSAGSYGIEYGWTMQWRIGWNNSEYFYNKGNPMGLRYIADSKPNTPPDDPEIPPITPPEEPPGDIEGALEVSHKVLLGTPGNFDGRSGEVLYENTIDHISIPSDVNTGALGDTDARLVDSNGIRYRYAGYVSTNRGNTVSTQTSRTNIVNVNTNMEYSITYYYVPATKRVNIIHRQIQSNNGNLDGRSGDDLFTEQRDVELDKTERFNAFNDNDSRLVDDEGNTGYRYVGLTSVNNGSTVNNTSNRYVDVNITSAVDTIIIYYGQEVGCEPGYTEQVTSDGLECIENVTKDGNKLGVYYNTYLQKTDNTFYHSSVSDAIYNAAGFISEGDDYYAVTGITSTLTNDTDNTLSDVSGHNEELIYVTDELNNTQVTNHLGTGEQEQININIANLPTDALNVSELSVDAVEGLDMTEWTNDLATTTKVSSDNLNNEGSAVTHTLTADFITELTHKYDSILTYGGRHFLADYEESELGLDSVTTETKTTSATSIYADTYGKTKQGQLDTALPVGYEYLDAEGETETRLYNERMVLANLPNSDNVSATGEVGQVTIDTQQAIDITDRLAYTNELENIDLPYVDNATQLTDEDKTLKFDNEQMYYQVTQIDNESQGIDSANLTQSEQDELDELLDTMYDEGNIITGTPLYKPLNDVKHTYRLNYDTYTTYGEGVHNMGITTDQVFATAYDSGLQVALDIKDHQTAGTTEIPGMVIPSSVELSGPVKQKGRFITANGVDGVYTDALAELGIDAVTSTDKLITNGDGALYFIPLNLDLSTPIHNRMILGQVGMNDIKMIRDDAYIVENHLYGTGDDAIYTPQRGNIDSGSSITVGGTYTTIPAEAISAVNEFFPVSRQVTVNGTRMMYSPIMDEITSGDVTEQTISIVQ